MGPYGTYVTYEGCLFSYSNGVDGQLRTPNTNTLASPFEDEDEPPNAERQTLTAEEILEFSQLGHGLAGVDQLSCQL